MKALLLFALWAIPVQADGPSAILISPDERQALIDKFGAMQEYIEKLEKAYKICRQVQSS